MLFLDKRRSIFELPLEDIWVPSGRGFLLDLFMRRTFGDWTLCFGPSFEEDITDF